MALNDLEDKIQCQVQIEKSFVAFKKLDNVVGVMWP